MRFSLVVVAVLSSVICVSALPAQTLDPLGPKGTPSQGNPLTDPGLSPEIEFLYQLEAKFAADTAKGGGHAFSSWFAADAVTLGNGKPPVVGHDAIAAAATWSPDVYQLTWTPEGARMGPAGDMGFTWGHYEGVAKDAQGSSVKTTGRYMTVWKRQSDSAWKVLLDASNEGPTEDCCRVK